MLMVDQEWEKVGIWVDNLRCICYVNVMKEMYFLTL